jgi:hypothetical protein
MKPACYLVATALFAASPIFAASSHGHDEGHAQGSSIEICEGFGPQAPRDIDSHTGSNTVAFPEAPAAADMHLCNIHFHENAEHKASGFSIYAGDGQHGYDSGYKCNISEHLSQAELAPTAEKICAGKHGDLVPGDTIEVHWVFTSCDVEPGPSLGSCLSDACANPSLRVESQVFTLVNDPTALDFNKLRAASDLPTNTGTPVVFPGSTTGPKYNQRKCSPYQVTWSVRPQCAKLDINSVGEWCKSNVFEEDHAHGVRALVTDPKLLSVIK